VEPFKDKKFLDLQKVWDKKLKDSGFEDAEQRKDGNLKEWATRKFRSKLKGSYYEQKKEYYLSREEYFRVAGFFLHDHDFSTEMERLIWELHSEGISIVDITNFLKKKWKKLNVYKVRTTIEDLVKIMKGGL
jgi:hypothetical protein